MRRVLEAVIVLLAVADAAGLAYHLELSGKLTDTGISARVLPVLRGARAEGGQFDAKRRCYLLYYASTNCHYCARNEAAWQRLERCCHSWLRFSPTGSDLETSPARCRAWHSGDTAHEHRS